MLFALLVFFFSFLEGTVRTRRTVVTWSPKNFASEDKRRIEIKNKRILSHIWWEADSSSKRFDTVLTKRMYMEYDTNGNKVHEYYYDEKGNITCNPACSMQYQYDDRGRVVEQRNYNNNQQLQWIESFLYDTSGRLFSEHRFFSYDSSKENVRYVYDNDSTEEAFGRASYDTVDHHVKWEYDHHGNLIQETANGITIDKYSYQYDDSGRTIGWQSCTNSDSSTMVIEYDGLMTKSVLYNADGSVRGRFITKNDRKGNVIERIELSPKDSVDFRIQFVYDEKGRHIETKSYDAEGRTYHMYGIKYDEHGNMITESHVELLPDRTKNTQKIVHEYEYYK